MTNTVFNLLTNFENLMNALKPFIVSLKEIYNEYYPKIGGHGRFIQIDGMVFKMEHLIKNPTTETILTLYRSWEP